MGRDNQNGHGDLPSHAACNTVYFHTAGIGQLDLRHLDMNAENQKHMAAHFAVERMARKTCGQRGMLILQKLRTFTDLYLVLRD